MLETEVQSILAVHGFRLVGKYRTTTRPVETICPNGHSFNLVWNRWKKSKKCPYCSNKKKWDIESVRTLLLLCGKKLLSTEYVNNRTPLNVQCMQCRSIYKASFTSLRRSRCSSCGYEGAIT